MNPDQAALLMVARLLERLTIPYMVTGSVASSYHGRPRSTHDVGVVIDPDADQLERLVLALTEAGYYVDAQRAREALGSRRQFSAIEMQSASKIDLIVCKDRPFSRAELARRQPAELAVDLRVSLASAEDVLLSKLEWAKLAGDSERQDRGRAWRARPECRARSRVRESLGGTTRGRGPVATAERGRRLEHRSAWPAFSPQSPGVGRPRRCAGPGRP